MKKYLAILVFVLFLPSVSLAAGTCGAGGTGGGASSPWTADSASYADVNACINTHMGRNEILNIPTGTVNWSSLLTITMGIKIIGAGTSNTIITSDNNNSLIKYDPDATAISSDEAFDISGLQLNMGGGTGTAAIWLDNNDSIDIFTKIKIHDNHLLNNASGSYGLLLVQGNFFGVVYDNIFESSVVSVRLHGADSGGIDGLGSWDNLSCKSDFGSSSFLFFEDNSFTGNSDFIYHEMGGRSVVRYNDIHMTTGGYDNILDLHGNQSGTCASMIAEFYGNDITKDIACVTLSQRGGHLLFAWNKITGGNCDMRQYSDALWTADCTESNTDDPVPLTWNINNRLDGAICDIAESSDIQDQIAEDSTFFNPSDAAYDGSTGTGCGAIGDRPASASLANSVYLATDISCASVANIGKDATVPFSGTAYYWTGSEWAVLWTPATYPHTSRGEWSVAITGDTEMTETEYRTGSKEWILTITGAEWDSTLCDEDNAATTALLGSFDGSDAEANGFDNTWSNVTHANCSCTSTVCTFTLPAQGTFDLANGSTTVTVDVDPDCVTDGGEGSVVASPTLTITYEAPVTPPLDPPAGGGSSVGSGGQGSSNG